MTNEQTNNDGWLSDLRVVDFSRLLPGPFCSVLLADMGADVIKVESPGGGDYARYYPPMVGEFGAFFAGINRNKRSVTLDLKTDAGAEAARKLIASADIVLESFRPGVMERLGLDYEAMSASHPELVYCSISGYGQDGPMSDRAGHDLNYLARAGLLEQNGDAGKKPVVPGFQLADIAGGALYSALGIMSAIHKRDRGGEGAHVDISMTEGALSFHLPMHSAMAAGQPQDRGQGMLTGGLPCYNIYETADGKYLSVAPLEPKFWMGFVQAIDAPELAGDGMSSGEDGERVKEKVAEIIATRTRDEWVEVFEEVDVCVEPILEPDEALFDELFKARQMFFKLQGIQHTRTPLTPKDRDHTGAPGLGQHTDDLLGELGYSDDEIAAMRDEDVL